MIKFKLIKESVRFALQALKVNRLRTFLSLLGVTIGIFIITAIFTFVDTMDANLKDMFSMLSDDVVFVQKMPWQPEDGDEEYRWWEYFQRRQPTVADRDMLEDRLELASAVSFQSGSFATAEYLNSSMENIQLAAVSYDYQETIKLNIESGRYFSASECIGGRNIAILGAEIASNLFGDVDPIDREIKVNGHKLSIIGVFEPEGVNLLSDGFDQIIMVPVKFGSRLIDLKNNECSIIVKAKDGISNDELKNEIIANYRSIRKIKPKDDKDFAVNEISMITAMIDSTIGAAEMGGWVIGLFAIFVGVFSIANIMFVSVRERTKIIGIQKALGAKSSFIMWQFLIESVTLCIFGALFAFVVLAILVGIINLSTDAISIGLYPSRFALGIGIASFSGVIAGIFPAKQAAEMNPVEAIRK